ncbi:kinase-like domain-containing protein [Cyathus striatus]|nr:kinase-like domain-containing protein [Cyathus striatus]
MPASSTSAYSDVSTVALEDFDVIEQIHDSKCTVYRVKCKKGRLRNRQLALKKFPTSGGFTSLPVDWEAMHQALCHPNIASLYSTLSTPLANYHVLELCPSGSLDDHMRTYGSQALEEYELRRFLKGLFDALGYLKNQRILHRGIDMSSILLTTELSVKLSDFKNAVQLPESEDITGIPVQYVTEFTAPELKNSSMHGFPVDMWSTGCVAITYLTRTNSLGIATRSPHTDFKASVLEMTPSKLKDLIYCLLRSEPADRLSVLEACHHAYFTPDRPLSSEFADNKWEPSPQMHTAGASKFKSLTNISKGDENAKTRISLKDILSNGYDLKVKEPVSKPNDRRVVSDPVRNTFLDKVDLLPRRSQSVSSTGKAKHAGSDAFTRQAIPIGTVRPSSFTTFPLHPRTHKAAYGHITILPSRSLLVDFREGQRRNGYKGDEVLLIGPNGTEVKIYKAPHLSTPCCLIEPTQQYTLQNIPAVYWNQYNNAAELIDHVKRKTPKLVEYGAGIKYTLMANTPLGDVEVIFNGHWLGHVSDSDEFALLKRSQPKMKLSLSKKRSSLEIARHIVNGDVEEWTKKVLAACQDSLYVTSDREFSQLERLEQKAVLELKRFLSVCISMENIGGSSTALISSHKTTQDASSSSLVHGVDSFRNNKSIPVTKASGSISQVGGTASVITERYSSTPCTTSILSPIQTRFLPSVGWCVRYSTYETPHSERYQILFLDGVILEVDVDQEMVEYTAIDGKKESCPVHECISKQYIFNRMDHFESFIALFETDT